MKKKRTFAATGIFTMIFFLAALVFAGVVAAKDKPIELKMSVEHPTKGGKYVRGHLPWSKMVEKATNGRVKVIIYPSSSLAKSKENFDGMIGGIVDIGWMPIPHYPGRFPLTEVFTFPAPGLFSAISASVAAWRMHQEIPEIRKEWEQVKVLFFHGYLPQTLASTKKEVHVPDDVKGMKLRCAGRGITSCFKAAGASPLYVQPPDIFLNLQKNVMEAVNIGWEGHKSFGVTKLAKYYVDLPALSGPIFAMGMSKRKWNQLGPDLQKAVWSVCGEVGAKLYGNGDDTSSRIVMDEELKNGKTVVKLTPEEQEKWFELARPVRDKMLDGLEKKGLPAKRIYSEFQKIVKEANAQYK
ncbi:MAG: TRAP transporter substrate-binding protein [Deltaproteobacteria bacterium]|nr:TRAP transporter substrate-binding protein [Deltaproteobacteria bacterium]